MDERVIDDVVDAPNKLVYIFSEHYQNLAIDTEEDISHISEAIKSLREICNEGVREVFGRHNSISDSDS